VLLLSLTRGLRHAVVQYWCCFNLDRCYVAIRLFSEPHLSEEILTDTMDLFFHTIHTSAFTRICRTLPTCNLIGCCSYTFIRSGPYGLSEKS